jgi:hypothetical protein
VSLSLGIPTNARASAAVVAAFLVGVGGLLVLGLLHVQNEGVWLAVGAVGIAAALAARAWVGLLGLLLGIAASIPIALGLGVIAFLGENWWVALVLSALLATAFYLGTVGLWLTLRLRA